MRLIICAILAFFLMGADANLYQGDIIAPAYASDKSDKEHLDFEYYEMDPLLIPVVNKRGLSQQVSFIVKIEVPYGELEKVSAYGPRLTDAYIQDMYGVLGAGYGLVNGNVLNIPAIKDRLSKVAAHVLGEDMVKGVLLQVVQQRPL